VIVGAGFGGLRAANTLRKAAAQVVVIDRSNHHLFQPLLSRVATGSLAFAEIATPLRRIFRDQPDAEVMLGDMTSVDVSGKRVSPADGEVSYDSLIVAAGATRRASATMTGRG
jgi:NADH dehydrogenase